MKSLPLLSLAMTAMIAFSAPACATGVSGSGSAGAGGGTAAATGTGTAGVGGTGATISGSAGVRSNATTQTTARSTASTNASSNSVVGGQALGTSTLDGNTNALGRGALDNTITGGVNGQPDPGNGSTRAAEGPVNGTNTGLGDAGADGGLGGGAANSIRGPLTADETQMMTNLNFGNSDSNHDGRLDSSEFTRAGLSATLFPSADSNHDGFVSDAELRAASGRR